MMNPKTAASNWHTMDEERSYLQYVLEHVNKDAQWLVYWRPEGNHGARLCIAQWSGTVFFSNGNPIQTKEVIRYAYINN